MKNSHINLILFSALFITSLKAYSQSENDSLSKSKGGWFSLGGRSTISLFDHDGAGLGTGGQFRIQLNNRVNTDWFADYININNSEDIRSTYYHIGWSVIYYPFESLQFPKILQP